MSLPLLLFLFASHASAHSLLTCVDWSGEGPCDEDVGYAYHPNHGKDFAYKLRYGPSELCRPPKKGDRADWSAQSGTAPAKAKAGEVKQLVWPCNEHCTLGNQEGSGNVQTYLYYSPEENPTSDLFSTTTPLHTFSFDNCKPTPKGLRMTGGSSSEFACFGDFKVPEGLSNGVHTFAWIWNWMNDWDDLLEGKDPYLTCFQYEITGGPEETDPAFLDQVNQPYTGELSNYKRADAALMDSGSAGIAILDSSVSNTPKTVAKNTSAESQTDSVYDKKYSDTADEYDNADSTTSSSAGSKKTSSPAQDEDAVKPLPSRQSAKTTGKPYDSNLADPADFGMDHELGQAQQKVTLGSGVDALVRPALWMLLVVVGVSCHF